MAFEVIEWTFDPLVARNAYFNLVKLAAEPSEYLTNFYGPMLDLINGKDDTDRLLVRWDLASPEVVAASAGTPRPRPAAHEGTCVSASPTTSRRCASTTRTRQRVADPGP